MEKVFVTSASLQKRYNTAMAFATLLGICCVVLGTYRFYVDTNAVSGSLLIFIGAIQFLWVWITSAVIKTTKLATTSKELKFYSPGLELTTAWDNLERIGIMTGRIKRVRYDSLILRNPATQKTSWLFQMFRKLPEKEIPLSMFSNWRTSEMGEEIKKYAPHLFR